MGRTFIGNGRVVRVFVINHANSFCLRVFSYAIGFSRVISGAFNRFPRGVRSSVLLDYHQFVFRELVLRSTYRGEEHLFTSYSRYIVSHSSQREVYVVFHGFFLGQPRFERGSSGRVSQVPKPVISSLLPKCFVFVR